MFPELKECIKDAFDPALKSYVDSYDYQQAKFEYNKMFYSLYNELPEEQQKKLTELSNARDDLESGLTVEAYYRGVVHGIELHNDVK